MKIGVVVPIADDPQAGPVPSYEQIRSYAQQAEAAGFDSIWLFDHLIMRPEDQAERGIWECWTLLTALAEATWRVELGTLVLCMPFRNPALLAKMAETLDAVSGGRLILGVGAGWHQPEFDAFGFPFDHRVDRFEEALQVLVPLLRQGRVSYHGQHHHAEQAVIRPRGPRPNGPPLLIAAFGPRMLRLTARFADAWNTAWIGLPEALAAQRSALLQACEAEGRDPAQISITVGVNIACDPAIAVESSNSIIAGSPAQIAEALRTYEASGVDHLICWPRPIHATSLGYLADALDLYRRGQT
ncbi:MAG TPA: LLM class flavin-dependent oxidoreductase [Roseiflexaceae bacterium]|nr:LLM class flavin-dependent oxidoreductase [Roseiflexaceae bacterium]HMP39282.1 LLM class flavin-dependent oxidoreductase [Roseiflexaceae bacterium]